MLRLRASQASEAAIAIPAKAGISERKAPVRPAATPGLRRTSAPRLSERTDDHQHDDQGDGDARHLVHDPQRPAADRTKAPFELLAIIDHPAMIAGEQDDDGEL